MECVFCKIINKELPASIVYEDHRCIAFMDISPVNIGQCLVIPKEHIDHFTDINDNLAAHIMVIGQKIGRKIMKVLKPERIGFVVHGYGVFHAHLVVVPQHNENDITSIKMLEVVDGKIHPNFKLLQTRSRKELDNTAEAIKI